MTAITHTLRIARAEHFRSEKDEQRLCDDFMRRASFDVVCHSQPQRATGVTLGVSDRRYRRRVPQRPEQGIAFAFEVKTDDPKSKLSREQHEYLIGEWEAGQRGACGTLEDLIAYHRVLVQGSLAEILGHERHLMAKWVAKGYRRERKPAPFKRGGFKRQRRRA